jgi:hypothetical protein
VINKERGDQKRITKGRSEVKKNERQKEEITNFKSTSGIDS